MWPFSMEFVPEGEPEGCEWRRERGSLHPLDGGGGMELAPKRQLLFWAGGLKEQNCCVRGRNNKVAL
jgi:hypothetical protein